MKHFVLLKFAPAYLTAENYLEITNAFQNLKNALPEHIQNAVVHQNIVERAGNMDIMIELDLASADSLSIYLNHPIHLAIGEKMNPHIISRVSFDYN